MKTKSRLYGAFLAVFAALFIFAAADSIFNNRTIYFNYKPAALFIGTALCCAAGFFAARILQKLPALSEKKERVILPLLTLFYLAFLLYAGFSMRVEITPDWDFGVVLGAAQSYVNTGEHLADYFDLFYNNAPLYVFFTWLFDILKAFGITDFYGAAIVLNCLALTASLVLLYFAVRLLFGAKWALCAFILTGACAGVFAYAPIVYTDTLSMPFPVLICLIWLYARDALAAGKYRRGAALCALIGVCAALGARLKITVAIALIAVIIDALILLKTRAKLVSVAALLVTFVIIYFALGAVIAASPALTPRNADNAVPYTHWVMMGLHGDGYYYDPDYQSTLAAGGYAARVEYNLTEIKARIEAFGAGGLAKHFADKLSFIWGDGTFFAPMKLRQAPLSYAPLHYFLLFEQGGFGLFAYAFTSAHLAALIYMAVGALAAFKRRKLNSANDGGEGESASAVSTAFMPLCLFGVTMFLLIWEARSRYIVNFIPIIAICAVCGLFAASKLWYTDK